MTETQITNADGAVVPALDAGTLRSRYDAIVDGDTGDRSRHVRPEDLVAQRSQGHDLIERLSTEGVDVTDVARNTYGDIEFTMRDGFIRQLLGLDGFETQARSRKGQRYRAKGSTKDPAEILRTYIDVIVPEAAEVTRIEDEKDRQDEERNNAMKADDDAIIALYEGLSEEMRAGFKALLGYVALAERRNNRGFHMSGPPIANMLLMNLERTEKGGLPEFDPRHAGRGFHW